MARFKIGEQVISRPKSVGCAPAGEICRVVKIIPDQSAFVLYRVRTKDGIDFSNYEDELAPIPEDFGCDYCLKGKSIEHIADEKIYLYSNILGNELITVLDFGVFDQEIRKKIDYCPYCERELRELPYEEMEEEIDE